MKVTSYTKDGKVFIISRNIQKVVKQEGYHELIGSNGYKSIVCGTITIEHENKTEKLMQVPKSRSECFHALILNGVIESVKEQLQDALDKGNNEEIDRFITQLMPTDLDYYPVSTPYMERTKKTVSDMVREFGVDWCEYPTPTMCPNCCEDLRSEDGPPFKKEIAIVNYELGIIVDFVCPTCYFSTETGKEYSDEEMKYTEYFKE